MKLITDPYHIWFGHRATDQIHYTVIDGIQHVATRTHGQHVFYNIGPRTDWETTHPQFGPRVVAQFECPYNGYTLDEGPNGPVRSKHPTVLPRGKP